MKYPSIKRLLMDNEHNQNFTTYQDFDRSVKMTITGLAEGYTS